MPAGFRPQPAVAFPSVILDIFNRGSRVFAFSFVCDENDTGFPITNVGNDRKESTFSR